jgi:hypothetical protein
MIISEKLKSNKYILIGLFCLSNTTIVAGNVHDRFDGLQVHGFLTQGYVNTTSNNFFGDSEDGSFDFRELGINASYRFNPQLMTSAQVLSRKAGEMYDGSLNLDYGQIDYTAYTSKQSRIGGLLGRFKNPLGFYNDTRDVASTRPSIFVPQVIYWDRVRNTLLSNDGVLLYGDFNQDLHSIYVQFFAGKILIDENIEIVYLPAQLNPNLDQSGLTKGGRLLYEWNGGIFRLALSGATLKMDGDMAGGTLHGSIDLDYWIASAQYNQGPWSLTMEYMNEPIEYEGFDGIMDRVNSTVEGYYLQGNYRVSPDWEVLMRYEEGYFDKHDRNASDIQLPGRLPYNLFTRMLTLGILWEPISNLLLRAEFSRVDGTLFLSDIENPNPYDTKRNWNMFALLFSYSF